MLIWASLEIHWERNSNGTTTFSTIYEIIDNRSFWCTTTFHSLNISDNFCYNFFSLVNAVYLPSLLSFFRGKSKLNNKCSMLSSINAQYARLFLFTPKQLFCAHIIRFWFLTTWIWTAFAIPLLVFARVPFMHCMHRIHIPLLFPNRFPSHSKFQLFGKHSSKLAGSTPSLVGGTRSLWKERKS